MTARTHRRPVRRRSRRAAGAGLGVAFLLLPMVGAARSGRRGATWSPLLGNDDVLTPLRLSLETASLATVDRRSSSAYRWRGCWPGWSSAAGALLRALVTLPLVLPPVVGGVALLLAFGRNGVARAVAVRGHRLLAAVHHDRRRRRRDLRRHAVPGRVRRGRRCACSTPASTRQQQLSAPPGGTRSPGSPCRCSRPASPPGPCCAGRGHSASSARRSPSPAASRARTQTMPIAVYLALQDNPDAAIALSLVLLVVSIAILAGLRERWLRA